MEEAPGRIDALVFEGHLQVTGVLGFSLQYLAAGRVCQSHPHPLGMLVRIAQAELMAAVHHRHL